jgi:hypothetical protein
VRVSDIPTSIRATVVGSEFLGEAHRMTCAIAGLEQPLVVRTTAPPPCAPGDAVFLNIDAAGAVVVADDATSAAVVAR